MVEWVKVGLDLVALFLSVSAFLYARSKDRGSEHRAAVAAVSQIAQEGDKRLEKFIEELFQRQRAMELTVMETATTVKGQPDRSDFQSVQQSISLFASEISRNVGELKGEMKATTRQVDLMNAFLMREPPK
jgi:hypothetical protein